MKKDLKRVLATSLLIIFQIVNCMPTYAQDAPDLIPRLKSLKQVSPNQIEISYDISVDLVKGKTATNYWIQTVTEAIPLGIATLGKDDQVNDSNSLTPDKVQIQAKDREQKIFTLTFSQPITSGKRYKLMIYYVTIPDGPPYAGDNGSKEFTGQ